MENILDSLLVEHVRSNQHSSPFHRHNNFELYLFISGDVTFFTESEGFILEPGYLLPIQPRSWHRAKTNSIDSYERLYLNFSPLLVAELSTENTNLASCFYPLVEKQQPIVQLQEYNCQHFINYSKELKEAMSSNSFGKDIKIRALLMELLLIANLPPSKNETKLEVDLPSLISKMLLFIDVNIASDLSLEHFSKTFFMNGTYLSRYFKKFMGITLQEYIISKRIELAKEYLLRGSSVDTASELAGFGSYYNFIRIFKSRVGVPPGTYKKRQKINYVK